MDAPKRARQAGRACSHTGCERKCRSRGLCGAHYERLMRGHPMDAPVQGRQKSTGTCSRPGCTAKDKAKGLCNFHYGRLFAGIDLAKPKRGSTLFCTLSFCNEKHLAQGLCGLHYRRSRSGRPLDAPKWIPKKKRICNIRGCLRKHYGKGLCSFHYQRNLKGVPLNRDPHSHPLGCNKTDTHSGYVKIKIGKDYQNTDKDGWILKHRCVMQQCIGRPLLGHEDVHHKNGIRDDNRIENLELWSSSHPRGQRVADKLKWAREILELYGNLPLFESPR